MLIPSIDLVKGQAVQLRHGEELELVADEDPRELARRFGRVGQVTVIDLDAARETGDNLALIEEMCAIAPCRVGGGSVTWNGDSASCALVPAGSSSAPARSRSSSSGFPRAG